MAFAMNGKSKKHIIFLIIGILLIAANLRAPFTGLPPLLGILSHDYDLTTVAAGVLTIVPLLAFAIISPFGGFFAQKYGLERSLFGALIIIALGIVFRSLESIWCLYLGSWLIGMGIAIGNVLLPSLVKRDFPDKIALVTSAYALTMGIAAAICSAIAIPLANSFGWRGALGIFLILPVVAMLFWFQQLGSKTQPITTTVNSSYEGKIWRSSIAWQVTSFVGLISAIYYIIIGWLPMILIEAGMTPVEAGTQHGILQLATAIPGLILAPIISKMDNQRLPAAMSCILSGIALLGILWFPALSFVWSILFGIGIGAGFILGLTFIGLRTQNAQQAVALSGMSQCIGYLLAAIGPIAMGALHDVLNSWTIPLYIAILLTVIAAIMGTFAGRNIHINYENNSKN